MDGSRLDALDSLVRVAIEEPLHHLVPYRDRTLAIRGMEGYRVELQREGGAIETVVFHQPNGTFLARRGAE
jgi:hypothetical protein